MRKRPDLIMEVGNFVGDTFVPAPVSKPQNRPSVQAVDDFTTRSEDHKARAEDHYTLPQKIVYRRRRTLARIGGSVWWCDLIVEGS